MSSVAEKLDEIEMLHGNPMEIISSCIRGFIIPREGHDFIGVDFSSIEARVTAWISGEERLLELYRQGGDPYVDAASSVFTGKITKDQRQVGKVMVLSWGFGGGVGAFQMMGKSYGVERPDNEVERWKKAWRAKNKHIVAYWHKLEQAAISAMKSGKRIKCGMVSYKKSGSFLTCRLPSGRSIMYPYPKIEFKQTRMGPQEVLSAKGVDSKTKKWVRRKLWYGILIENIVQAIARDLLVCAMLGLEDANYEIMMHVHDELVTEIEKKMSSVQMVKDIILNSMPDWAETLPIEVEGWRGSRYQK